ncbi:MAG TPA: hypothetical protein VFQ84_08580 [Arenimonas sp.]|uniref:hypothetical protein n=1 Tax=Arenimonas sp. TaxID=1872635 RepID=UPI002D7E7EF3|nr:hypothetical protein [Arenimonas sp.]HEU0153384.1 hypothetical protein [Arenimonas sp.]
MNDLQTPADAPLKHSGPGVASFVLVVFFGLLLLAMFGYAGYLELNTPGGVDEESVEAIVAGMVMIFSIAAMFVAFVLGVIGLFVGRRKRLFAWLGAAMSGLLLLFTFLIFALGMAQG